MTLQVAGRLLHGERTLDGGALLRDGLVSAVAFALTVGMLAGAPGANRQVDALGVALAAIACFPLLARRRMPLAVFVVTTCSSATMNGLGYALGPPFGPTAALFFVALDERSRVRIRETTAVIFGMFVVHVGATAGAHAGFPTSPVLFGIIVWGGAWIAGDQLRQRRERRAAVEERLRQVERDMERERRLAAAEERTRIARDLHDSAAHAINVILVQAGAARLLQQRDPDAARDALTTIEDVARDTIGEIDLLVRGLRENGRNEDSAAIEPPTGLAALDTLTDRCRSSGLAVTIKIDGRPRQLPRRLDQAAYRILQESLTNAVRHGNGNADVRIRYAESELELSITNPIGPPSIDEPSSGGHGILGMRERASLLHGQLDAGRDGASFHVVARLPYTSEERS